MYYSLLSDLNQNTGYSGGIYITGTWRCNGLKNVIQGICCQLMLAASRSSSTYCRQQWVRTGALLHLYSTQGLTLFQIVFIGVGKDIWLLLKYDLIMRYYTHSITMVSHCYILSSCILSLCISTVRHGKCQPSNEIKDHAPRNLAKQSRRRWAWN